MTALSARRRAMLFAASGLVGIPWVGGCAATSAPRPPPIVLGTSTPGGGFALYGATLETVLNRRAGYALLKARTTRGTAENLELLDHGAIDAALIQGTAASALFDAGPTRGLRILYAMYPSPGLMAVPVASPARRLEDLRGKRIVFGVPASGLVTLARQVLAGIGLDVDRDFDAIYVDEAAESPRLVLAGRADGLWGAGEGWPGFEALARSPGGARFIGPRPEQIARIVERFPSLTPMEVAARTYPGIDRPLPTVGSVNWILVRADFDDARATAFVDAMRDAAADLVAALPQAGFSTLAHTRASAPSPALLHRAVAPR